MDLLPARRSVARPELLSAAPTITRGKGAGAVRTGELLAAGQVLTSPQSGVQYRVLRLLGAGGFGQVYLARRLGRSAAVPSTLCIKVGERTDAWVREAYFGQLLDSHPRAIRVYEAFPVARPRGRFLYCLALEYARHGDLRAFLHRN